MTECVDEILDQLKLGARWYARSKNDIDNIRQERTENEKRISEQKEIAYTTGEGQGKQDVIEKLLGQFNDIDKLMKKGNCDNYEESVTGMIASFLRDNGLESEFEVGEEVEISVENSSDIQNK
jgi:soluble cytochrome b562